MFFVFGAFAFFLRMADLVEVGIVAELGSRDLIRWMCVKWLSGDVAREVGDENYRLPE
jgi:hypothetical protein